MSTYLVIDTWQARFAMPSSGRVRMSALRNLPVTTDSATTDSAVNGAFPGPSAWSPPI